MREVAKVTSNLAIEKENWMLKPRIILKYCSQVKIRKPRLDWKASSGRIGWLHPVCPTGSHCCSPAACILHQALIKRGFTCGYVQQVRGGGKSATWSLREDPPPQTHALDPVTGSQRQLGVCLGGQMSSRPTASAFLSRNRHRVRPRLRPMKPTAPHHLR